MPPRLSQRKEYYDQSRFTGKTTVSPDVLVTIARLSTLAVPGVSRMAPIPGGVNRLFRRGHVTESASRSNRTQFSLTFTLMSSRMSTSASQPERPETNGTRHPGDGWDGDRAREHPYRGHRLRGFRGLTSMKSRTRARGLALQVLYEVDMANHPPVEVFQSRLEDNTLSDELTEFSRQIVFGVLPLIQDLDEMIAKYAPEWPLDQVAVIDRNILRHSILGIRRAEGYARQGSHQRGGGTG